MAWPAPAHVVYGTTTLRLLALQSDLVARVRIVDPAAEIVLADPPLRETVVVAQVLELLKGEGVEGEIRFVQHAHGVVAYAEGDEVLLFVDRIAKSPEFAKSRIAQHVKWLSQQESGAKFALRDDDREAVVAAVRAYLSLEQLAPGARIDALRRISIELLASPHPLLAASALRDLVLAAELPLVSAADLPALEAVLTKPETAIGIRIGLLAELERRRLLDAAPRWAALLRSTSGADRIAVVRAVGAHPSEAVERELVKLSTAKDVQLVAAAAVSLGSSRNDAAIETLAKLLQASEPRVRMAAIRGLGRSGSPAAKQALAKAATTHADPATRRRAAAEVALLDGRGETPAPR